MFYQDDAGHILPLSQGLGAEGRAYDSPLHPHSILSLAKKVQPGLGLSASFGPSSGWGLSAARTSVLKLSVRAMTGTGIIGLTFINILSCLILRISGPGYS